jgi:integrase
MSNQIVPLSLNELIPASADKHTRYRMGKFASWMATQGRPWHKPDLAAWRDYLLANGQEDGSPMQPRSVSALLGTVRAHYDRLLRSNRVRDALFEMAARVSDRPADRKAFVDELLIRLENAVDPKASPVKVKTFQDRADDEHLRLTFEQANALLAAPGVETLRGLRDTAIVGLMLCTGIREAELAALDVRDLRQRLGGGLALHVREGKGRKERLIPYGALEWVLAVVDRWLEEAGIERGAVFRGFYKGNERVRPGRLSRRAIQYIVTGYPVVVEGELVCVRPHDLRRTYARRLYEARVDLVAIQQNLGHADLETTLGYIGELDAEARKPPAVYEFDLGRLADAPRQARLPV